MWTKLGWWKWFSLVLHLMFQFVCMSVDSELSLCQISLNDATANRIDGIKWNVLHLINRKSFFIWRSIHCCYCCCCVCFICRWFSHHQLVDQEMSVGWMVGWIEDWGDWRVDNGFHLNELLIDKHSPYKCWTVHVLSEEYDAKEWDEDESSYTFLYVSLYAFHHMTQALGDDVVVIYGIIVDNNSICTTAVRRSARRPHIIIFLMMSWELCQ